MMFVTVNIKQVTMITNLPDHGGVLLRFSRPQHTISYSLVILSEISHHHGLDSTRDKDGRTLVLILLT